VGCFSLGFGGFKRPKGKKVNPGNGRVKERNEIKLIIEVQGGKRGGGLRNANGLGPKAFGLHPLGFGGGLPGSQVRKDQQPDYFKKDKSATTGPVQIRPIVPGGNEAEPTEKK